MDATELREHAEHTIGSAAHQCTALFEIAAWLAELVDGQHEHIRLLRENLELGKKDLEMRRENQAFNRDPSKLAEQVQKSLQLIMQDEGAGVPTVEPVIADRPSRGRFIRHKREPQEPPK